MGSFARAFESCIRTAQISRAAAAASAGVHPSVLSRLLNGDTQLTTEHVSALLRALPDRSDQTYCLVAWLKDQCPEDFRDDVRISFGTIAEDKLREPDSLSRALSTLERAATYRDEMKRLLTYLAGLEDPRIADEANSPSPVDEIVHQEDARRAREARNGAPKRDASARIGPESKG